MEDLDKLYQQYADTVCRYLLVKTGSAQLAEELTQETFYQAVRTIRRYDGSCQLSTWLIGIAKNVLYTYWQKQRHETVSLEQISEPTVPSPEEDVLRKLGMEEVMAVIHRVPEPGREVLYLRLLGDLSFRQIGAIMGQTENWARVTFFRAKQNVVKELSKDESSIAL